MSITLAGGVDVVRRRLDEFGADDTAAWVVAKAGEHRAASEALAAGLQLFDGDGKPDGMLISLAGGVDAVRRYRAAHGDAETAAWVVAKAGEHAAKQNALAAQLGLINGDGEPDGMRIAVAGGVDAVRRYRAAHGDAATAAWVRASYGRQMAAIWTIRYAKLMDLARRIPGSDLFTIVGSTCSVPEVLRFLETESAAEVLARLKANQRSCTPERGDTCLRARAALFC